jgi:PKD repeat protein
MNHLPPATLLVPLEPFWFILKINKDIRNARYTGGKFTDSTFDTSKFTTSVNDTGGYTFPGIYTVSVTAANDASSNLTVTPVAMTPVVKK